MNEVKLVDAAEFGERYPDRPAKIAISIKSPLLERRRLIALGKSLQPHLLEYNSGEVPISTSPDAIPPSGRSFEETVLEIGERNSWVNLRNLEWDPEYKTFTDECVAPIADLVTAKTGPIIQRENFLFISSAGAVTPAHIDEEHSVLFQVEGEKVVTIYSQSDREIVPQEKLEEFHSGGHRNVIIKPEQEKRGQAFRLKPGEALYIPPLAPHWVK
ncbi:MAG: cupin-like domain-containing protein, partial [Parvularculaceae bacterium]|nr:cupin-like domain-containing protein [Parvularculaceae bacterium]